MLDIYNKEAQPIPLGRAEKCAVKLSDAEFLGFEHSGTTDSFGSINQAGGIEMIYRRPQGEIIKVNPDLFVAALGYCEIRMQGTLQKLKDDNAKARVLLNLPIGGGAIIGRQNTL